MRKVNWVKVPRNVATKPSTLWHPSTKDDERVEPKVHVNTETVEELFSRAEIVKKTKEQGEVEAKPKVISLLDQKTSLNVNIFLKQFKRCVYPSIPPFPPPSLPLSLPPTLHPFRVFLSQLIMSQLAPPPSHAPPLSPQRECCHCGSHQRR